MSDVDAMDLNELRMAIAEARGYRYYWYSGLGECYLRDLGVQNTNAMTTLTGRPDGLVNMEYVPDWPRDIAAAMGLVVDMPDFILSRRTAGWECTGRLCWSGRAGFTHITARDGKPVCICAVGAGDTPAEAISRAWLKAST